jgi:PhnB protein
MIYDADNQRDNPPRTKVNPYKPDTYPSVSPYLIVTDTGATIDFLTTAFGAVEIRRFATPDGRVMHAEVRLDDAIVMLADCAEQWPAIESHVHVYVPDVDAAYQRALQHGAKAVQAPVKKSDEDKRGGVKDPWGTTWWIATKVE